MHFIAQSDNTIFLALRTIPALFRIKICNSCEKHASQIAMNF